MDGEKQMSHVCGKADFMAVMCYRLCTPGAVKYKEQNRLSHKGLYLQANQGNTIKDPL